MGAGQTTVIAHMPFDRAALSASVDQIVSTGAAPAPQFEEGYQEWRSANGGIFTISVPQAVGAMFEMFEANLAATRGN
jgi:hypothetical protein